MSKTFSNGENFINVHTVGELKSVLAELDDDMPIEQGLSNSVDVMIYSNPNDELHIEFEDGDSN